MDGRTHSIGHQNAADNDHSRRDQNIHLSLLVDHFAQLNRHNDSGIRSHRATEFVARNAHGDGTEQYQALTAEFVGDGHRNGGSRGGFGVFRDGGESLNARLVAQGLEDGADEQRGEQAQRHSAKSVDKIGLPSEVDVFSVQEVFEFSHR